MSQKCVLIITDGIGYKPDSPYNAFANATKPTYDWLFKNVPYSLIHTYGESVGLPEGQMGNSESRAYEYRLWACALPRFGADLARARV